MTIAEGLFIGAIYFVAVLGTLLVAGAVIHVIGAERLARWLHLPGGFDQ